MRLLALLLFTVSAALPALAQTTTTHDDLGAFTGIRASNAFDVDVERGDAHVAVVTAPDKYADRIVVEVVDGMLVLGVKRGESLDMRGSDKLHATVTMPRLEAVDVSGAVTLRSDERWSGDGFALQASGAADVELVVEVESLAISASGASDCKLEGRSTDLVVEASGASDIDAADVEAAQVAVSSSGASDVSIHASESITATASGGSDIRYTGAAERVSINASGGSDITRG